MLRGASVASAAALQSSGPATNQANSAAMQHSSAATKMAPPARDALQLSSAQRQKAWKDLYVKSLNQKTPAGFHAASGAVMPNSVTTSPITAKAARDVPALKPYHFAMLQDKLLIVNPTDKKIVDVIVR